MALDLVIKYAENFIAITIKETVSEIMMAFFLFEKSLSSIWIEKFSETTAFDLILNHGKPKKHVEKTLNSSGL